MSYEAWGDDDDGLDGYREQLLDAGWWDDDQTNSVTEAIKTLHATTIYEGGEKDKGVSVEFLARMTLLREAAGLLDPDDKWVVDARREIAEITTSGSDEKTSDDPKTTLTDGSQVTDDHRELKKNGQQKGYVVLSEEERSQGFVRPVRNTYKHITCGTTTNCARPIAETFARDPKFYSGTFCGSCRGHFPLEEFVWYGTKEVVGS